jgi:dihydrolipoamide dehydrogenase
MSGSASPHGSESHGVELHAEVAVIGGGPGGYAAAFRAADLGLRTVLVESAPTLGGVCLNVGCIPSKALLHVARVIAEAETATDLGVSFEAPRIDLAAIRAFKDSVVSRLTRGLEGLASQRGVQVVRGVGRLSSPHVITVEHVGETTSVSFDDCIIAVGSRALTLPALPEDPRIMDSTEALELAELPRRLLVIGGGIIGLEMATIYDALGSNVTIVEQLDSLIAAADDDLVRPLHQRIANRYEAIHLSTRVESVLAARKGLTVELLGPDGQRRTEMFDRLLVAIGRQPNGATVDAENVGVAVDRRGFIAVDTQMRTNIPHIYAIGDVAGEPMLAHKATHEAKVAAEAIAGRDAAFDARAIPTVAYTDPEIAWMGLTEKQAAATGQSYETAIFPWAASGRALTLARSEGKTKLLIDPANRRILGAGIVGVNAGELIAETVHALEMGAAATDLGLTIHPHPTLSETLGMAAEAAMGTITDLPPASPRASD